MPLYGNAGQGLWDLQETGSFKLVTTLSILNRAGARTHQFIDCTLRHISILRSYEVKYLRFYLLLEPFSPYTKER